MKDRKTGVTMMRYNQRMCEQNTQNMEETMSSVRRVYVEKKAPFAVKAKELKHEISSYLGIQTVTNNTVSFNSSKDLAIVGDFSTFKWGYSKEIPLEIIEYGDPDNSGQGLKGCGQVYMRAKAYIGWGIMDKSAFAVIQSAAE